MVCAGWMGLPRLNHGLGLAGARCARDCAPYHKYVVVRFMQSYPIVRSKSGIAATFCHRHEPARVGGADWALVAGWRLRSEDFSSPKNQNARLVWPPAGRGERR